MPGALTLTSQVDHDTTTAILDRLAVLFGVPSPEVLFEQSSSVDIVGRAYGTQYIAYSFPARREIHFRAEYIPWHAPFHEFGHVLYFDYFGSVDKLKSEQFAQWFASLSLNSGQDLLNFKCELCGQSYIKLNWDGNIICNVCGSAYAIDIFGF